MNRKKSQKQNVIDHLVEHKSITPLEALNLYGIFRLGAIIHTLRHKHKMHISSKIADGDKNYAIYTWGKPDDSALKQKKEEKKDEQAGFGFKVKSKYDGWPD